MISLVPGTAGPYRRIRANNEQTPELAIFVQFKAETHEA